MADKVIGGRPHLKQVDELWAFVAVDPEDGNEGILSQKAWIPEAGGNVMMPFVGADKARVTALRPRAQEIATSQKMTIRLMRFSKRELIEEIRPRPDGKAL